MGAGPGKGILVLGGGLPEVFPLFPPMEATNMRSGAFLAVVAVLGFWGILGCSGRTAGYPPLGLVSGTVTFEGQPVSGVIVTFQPVERGRPSTGKTDAAGRYALEFTEVAKGAMVGRHDVSFERPPTDEDLKAADAKQRSRKPGALAAALSRRTTCDVPAGRTTFDIELSAVGK
jgi:hypothetical protein